MSTTTIWRVASKPSDSGPQHIHINILIILHKHRQMPHRRLLKKIMGLWNPWSDLQLDKKNFLSDRKQKVIVDGKTSTTANVSSGIPQGSVLGPILFLIFINDFPLVIQAFIKRFDDDAKIYQIVSSLAEVAQLQDVLDNSVDWALVWNMFFNFKKCKHMHLGIHDMNQTYTMKKDQEEVPIEKVRFCLNTIRITNI